MVYPFKCTVCSVEWDEDRTVEHRDDPAKCSICGNVSQRQTTTVPFHLKGPGWGRHGYAKQPHDEV